LMAEVGGLVTKPQTPAIQPLNERESYYLFFVKYYIKIFKIKCFTIFYKVFYV